ncbi:MAG: nuclear transport factor 2 family protein [Defluviitaleaceae bacterium]|nr:nuclear transport factor 2 family protein [Defluviitaleaceae bacterium]
MEKYPTEEFGKYMEAINTRKFSQIEKLLHENATFCHLGNMKADLENVRIFHENFWNTINDSKWWATDVEIIYSDSKCQVYTYQYNYSGYVEGKQIEGNGKSTDIFVKNDSTERWELLHEHSSSMTPNHDD